MKTLKSIVLGLSLLCVVGAANAAAKPAPVKPTKDDALNTYVNAVSHGKLDGLSNVVDESAKLSTMQGTNIKSFTRDEMIQDMQSTKGVDQNCTVSTSDLESSDNLSIVKVDMKYDGFVRSNYVTMTNTTDGWKITSVYSVYK